MRYGGNLRGAMILYQATGKLDSVLEREGWTRDEMVSVVAMEVLIGKAHRMNTAKLKKG